MAVDPLKRRIRKNDVEAFAFRGCPFGDIARAPFGLGTQSAGLFDHVRRAVETGNGGVGPALDDHFGAISWAATEVDDAQGTPDFDVGSEITARARAFIGEFEVLVRIPSRHAAFILAYCAGAP